VETGHLVIEEPYQDMNCKSTETRLDYNGIIYAKSKEKPNPLIKSKR